MSLAEHASRINAPGRAIAYALLSSFLLTSNDAVVKWISGDLAVGEIIFLRGAVSIVAILAYAARHGGFAALRVSNWRGQTVRGACMVGGTFLFVTALGRMPLADVITLVFIAPILIAAVSPFALGEPVGWRRWSAIVCGFVGVIVMLRPGAEFYWAALLPLAAASLGATRDIVTRRINLTESSLAMLFYTTVMETLAGLATAPFGWQMPSVGTLAFAAGLAGVGFPRAPGSSRQRCGRCTGLDGVLCALRGGRSTQRPLRAVDDGQGADLCLRDGHILLARGGEEAGGGCSVSDARGGQLPATSHGM